MESLRLRLLNKFGSPENLEGPFEVEVNFPRESSDALTKRMSNGHVKILNGSKGELEVELSDFDVQALNVGQDQNFTVKVYSQGKIKTGVFARTLSVEKKMIDGNERKVLVKK